MKKVELNININPQYFGINATNDYVESFAFNLARNVEKIFNVKSEYNTDFSSNTYSVMSEDRGLELQISEYIESNWHKTAPKAV